MFEEMCAKQDHFLMAKKPNCLLQLMDVQDCSLLLHRVTSAM